MNQDDVSRSSVSQRTWIPDKGLVRGPEHNQDTHSSVHQVDRALVSFEMTAAHLLGTPEDGAEKQTPSVSYGPLAWARTFSRGI